MTRIERYIKSELKLGVTNYKQRSYNEIIKDLSAGEITSEDSIVSTARTINLIQDATYFIHKNDSLANYMFGLFNKTVKRYQTDLVYDFKYIFEYPSKYYYWFLRETGSDIAINNSEDIKAYAKKNTIIYRIDKENNIISKINIKDIENV